MIIYVQGDIFQSNAQALVNTVNTVGIMGKGLALQFKKRYPHNFHEYEKACKANKVVLGKMFISHDTFMGIKKTIINFPTKNSWKNKSRLEDIICGLQDLLAELQARGIKSVAIPPLGCGLGGLRWHDVKDEIEKTFANFPDIEIQVYEPLKTANPAPVQLAPKKLTDIKASVLVSFKRYMELAISTEMTFVETHKLCYLSQCFGLNFKLQFAPYRYGPFANNLNFLLRDMEGIWINGYRDGTQSAFDTFGILPKGDEAYKIISPENQEKLDKLFDFIRGYESPLGMELLGTVHWLAHEQKVPLKIPDIQKALQQWCGNRQGWGDRKVKIFPPPLIEKAIESIANI